ALLIEEIKGIRFKLECSMEELAIQTNKLKDVENGYNISDLEKSIEIYEKELEAIDIKLDGISEFYDSDVLMKAQDQIMMINASINHALTNTPASAIEAVAVAFERNSIMGYRASCVKKFEIAKAVEGSLFYKKLPAANSKIGELRAKVELKENLKKRPLDCKIDSCAFIKEALSIGNVEDELVKAESEYQELLKKYEDAKRNVEDVDATVKVLDSYSFIYKTIQANRFTFEKLPNSWAYSIKAYSERIRTGIVSDEYEDLSGYITVASLNDRHRDIVENIIPTIGNELKLARQTNEMVKIISDEVNRINNNIKEYEDKIFKSNQILGEYEEQITDLTELHQLLTILSEGTIKVDNLEKEYDIRKSEYAKYTLIEEEIRELNDKITQTLSSAKTQERIVKDLNRDRDTLNYQVQLHNEYLEEKDKFEKAYVNYEHIRYGLANKNGIPLVFIKIYLESTRLMCNRILEQLFHGEYKLLPFNITHNEFNIPCEVRGEVVADVSAMSGGERAILAIMLSLTLMQQSSSEGSYNIIHLDEMDAVLDSTNRLAFIQVLEELMNLFRIDQVIAISHNVGFESYPVDLVLLRDAKLENTDNKTVIYSLK
ncbi:MAG: hypothetical protein ACRCXX_10540, partial [Cetobacterium sp.]|uniref:hypothetical protein n=1 Tax=Cetobacterium sp. TaxID=2071632 RepID=UPI003F37B8EA